MYSSVKTKQMLQTDMLPYMFFGLRKKLMF